MDAKLNRLGVTSHLLLLAVVVALISTFFALGLDRYLTLDALRESEATLHAFVARHPLLSAGIFLVTYALVVGLSLPGGAVMTMSGGFLFGLWIGSVLSVVGATVGAIIIFLATRLVVGDALRARAGPFLSRMAEGFKRAAFSYLLFLRLMPLFPFWAVNLAPAFLGVGVGTFVAATAIGIIPGTLAYAAVGDGLGRYFAAGSEVPLNDVFSPKIMAVRVGLALLALLPVAIQWAKRRRT